MLSVFYDICLAGAKLCTSTNLRMSFFSRAERFRSPCLDWKLVYLQNTTQHGN